jgi:hypothetical protein
MQHRILGYDNFSEKKKKKLAWIHELTMPTERPPLVDEVSASFCG